MKPLKTNMKISFLSLLVVISLTSCGTDQKKTPDNVQPINVTVSSPAIRNGGAYFSASGKIETEQFATISTRMMGFVSKIPVKVGDKVRKGQLLIIINNDGIEAKKAQANAGLTQAESGFYIAQKDFNRFKILYEQTSVSQKEFDDITSRYTIAKAQVEAAKQIKNEINAMLSYSNITAPFDGIITSKNINEGDLANPGMPLLTMEAPSAFVATALVPETQIINVKKGGNVEVVVKSSNESVKGIISEVSISSQNTGGQYLIKIKLNNDKDISLYSGMFVSTNFPVENSSNTTILVPKSALINKGQLTGIYTVSQNNTAILRWLRLGKTSGHDVEVLTGLSKDEEYITSAEGNLYNGVKLNIK